MASLKFRSKSSGPRTQTGCQTCRKRRVKCDEARPACGRCIRSGWNCDGYGPSIGATLANQVAGLSAQDLIIPSYAIPFKVTGSQTDRRLLHYFCVQGSHDIGGSLGSDFWNRTVLQESHHNNVVRQAVISLSALHLDYVTVDKTGNKTARPEALGQYGKSIRLVRRRLEGRSAETVRTALICCIIFYCCETLLRNNDSAVQHLNGGLGLLPCYQREQSQNDDEVAEMSIIFERLDLQATLFDDSRLPLLTPVPETAKGESSTLAEPFLRLEDAQHALVQMQSRLAHFLIMNVKTKQLESHDLPPGVGLEKGLLLRQFNLWYRRFSDFSKERKHDDQVMHSVHILLVQFRVSHLFLAPEFSEDPDQDGEPPNLSTTEVLDLAESVLQHSSERNAAAEAARNPYRNFSSETGIVAPLFLLAMKCPDETLSRRAGDLLALSQRREGLYDAATMAGIVNSLGESRLSGLEKESERYTSDSDRAALEDWLMDGHDEGEGGMDQLAKYT